MPEILIDDHAPVGEPTQIRERVVVAPAPGRFRPLPAEVFTTEGEWVSPGTLMAEINEGDEVVEVRSPFAGWVMGMLAFPGHSVRRGEGLFWIRAE